MNLFVADVRSTASHDHNKNVFSNSEIFLQHNACIIAKHEQSSSLSFDFSRMNPLRSGWKGLQTKELEAPAGDSNNNRN